MRAGHRESSVWKCRGSKVSAPRFCALVHVCREQDGQWTIRQLVYLVTCLLPGLYSREKLQEVSHTNKLPMPKKENEQSVTEPRATKQTVAAEVSNMRKYTRNQLDIATVMYSTRRTSTANA